MEELTNFRPEEREEVFQRVWQRVMAGRQEDPEDVPSALESSDIPEEGASSPETTVLPAGLPPHSDFPATGGFLGESSLDAAPMLQEFIRRAVNDGRTYQGLAKRVGGSSARALNALAAQEKVQARRLSAAYFLISGVKYWPEPAPSPPISSYLGTLRQRFKEEQTSMTALLAAVETTPDPLLQQLYWDLAREEWDHACKLRILVENA